MNEVQFVETDFKQRAYDGKWERLGRIKDLANAYKFKTETGQEVINIPTKWITIGVYDYLMTIED